MRFLKSLSVLLSLLQLSIPSSSQSPTVSTRTSKPPIDSSVFDKWPSVGGAKISNDGKYVFYTINNQPVGSVTGILQSTSTEWKMELLNVSSVSFTDDSRLAIFMKNQDSLSLYNLSNKSAKYISHVSTFQVVKSNSSEWLIYRISDTIQKVYIRNLTTEESISLDFVSDFWVDVNNGVLLLKLIRSESGDKLCSLECYYLESKRKISIWHGVDFEKPVFDQKAKQIAFLTADSVEGKVSKAIWYYVEGEYKAALLADNHCCGIENGLAIESIRQFSIDGKKLLIDLKEEETIRPVKEMVKLDVWGYMDPKVLPEQLSTQKPTHCLASLLIEEKKIINLQYKSDKSFFTQGQSDTYIIAKSSNGGSFGEVYWNETAKPTVWLINSNTGERREINEGFLSPEKKFIIYFDPASKHYFSHSVDDNKIRCISKIIPTSLATDFNVRHGFESFGIAGWLENEGRVLIYDEFDIWTVDISGQSKPLNLTNGYGRKNKMILRLAINPHGNLLVPKKGKLLMSGYSRLTKKNGFFEMEVGKNINPVCLTFGLFTYYAPQKERVEDIGFLPIKAKKANIYLCRRESATESPNYFFTSDFKSFTRLSNIYPERRYNWITSELHTWRAPDGKELQGVLYKPENFDSSKRYPVIFYYYEIMSDNLTMFQAPSTSGHGLNVPSIVSNGYLVFSPDILYTIGEPFRSTYYAVVSAAKYLSKFAFVDSSRLGIQGNSWGAIQTNYLVTHSHIFAAACATAGSSNLISHYGQIHHQAAGQNSMERGQYRLGATLWERPDWFVKSSPVMNIHKVTTPVLLMNNKKDGAVPYEQGVEFITSLRRLGKRAWMLQYDDGLHGVDGEIGQDLTVRMMQFFNHYLKDSACPKWMLYGIPASRKGIDDGLELVKIKDAKTGKWVTPPVGVERHGPPARVSRFEK